MYALLRDDWVVGWNWRGCVGPGFTALRTGRRYGAAPEVNWRLQDAIRGRKCKFLAGTREASGNPEELAADAKIPAVGRDLRVCGNQRV
jgi:hypothetical protein